MLNADFNWDCPTCKRVNWEGAADDGCTYRCRGCNRVFFLTFAVEVEGIEEKVEEG